MSPVSPMDYSADSAIADSKLNSKVCAPLAVLDAASNISNLHFCQFVPVVLTLRQVRPSLKCGAAFGRHVPSVVPFGPEKQVVGPDAGANITLVQHAEIICDRSVFNIPGDTMCVKRPAFDVELPVSGGEEASAPQPAPIIRFANLGHKNLPIGSPTLGQFVNSVQHDYQYAEKLISVQV